MSDYLINNYSVESIQFKKPRKNGEYMVSKIKYSDSDFLIQLPKMKQLTEISKSVELEFIKNGLKYNEECYNFLHNINDHIIKVVSEKSEEWFGKKIPLDNIKTMYNSFIKAPKSSESQPTMNFNVKKDLILVDSKKKEASISDFQIDMEIDCIVHLKYVVFSKGNCFTVWDLQSAKLSKKPKIEKEKPNYEFINSESGSDSESELESDEVFQFFN